MMNFTDYQGMTRCVIPNKVTLSTNNYSDAFNSMSNLISVELSNKIVKWQECKLS